jgi:hypothetical protein
MALISGCVSAGSSGGASGFAGRVLSSGSDFAGFGSGPDFAECGFGSGSGFAARGLDFGFAEVMAPSVYLKAGNPLNALPLPAKQDATARGWYAAVIGRREGEDPYRPGRLRRG